MISEYGAQSTCYSDSLVPLSPYRVTPTSTPPHEPVHEAPQSVSHRADGAVAGGTASGPRAGARADRRERLHGGLRRNALHAARARGASLRRLGEEAADLEARALARVPEAAPRLRAGREGVRRRDRRDDDQSRLAAHPDGRRQHPDRPDLGRALRADGRRQTPPAGRDPLRGPAEDRRRPRLAQPPGPHGPAVAPTALAALPAAGLRRPAQQRLSREARASEAATISTGGSPRRSLPASRSRRFRRATTPIAVSSTGTGCSGAASS